MFDRRIACVVVGLSIAAAPAYAQSLGEVARQEEARRATMQKPAIVLSNSDLHPGEILQPAANPPAESCYMSISKGRCVTAEEMVSNSIAGRRTKENAPFETTWRQDAESIRSQIQRTQRSITTLEAVVADEERSPNDRKSAGLALQGARQALAGFERQWAKLERAAASQHVPRAWLEPIPTLATTQ
jgi:hypothetical protein